MLPQRPAASEGHIWEAHCNDEKHDKSEAVGKVENQAWKAWYVTWTLV